MLVCCSEIENKMMPADDAVSPMQGDRYPTGYIRRTDAAASGHDLAAEKLRTPWGCWYPAGTSISTLQGRST